MPHTSFRPDDFQSAVMEYPNLFAASQTVSACLEDHVAGHRIAQYMRKCNKTKWKGLVYCKTLGHNGLQ